MNSDESKETSVQSDPIKNFTISYYLDDYKDFLEKRRKEEIWGIEVKSFPKLTKALNGVRGIIVLYTGAKKGKSTFALQIASDIAEQGMGVIYYDFENGPENLISRIICRKYDVSYHNELFRPDSNKKDVIEKALDELKTQTNFLIINDPTLTKEKIKEQISYLKQNTKQEKTFLVIDSLQKIVRNELVILRDRRAAIDYWLRTFDSLYVEDFDLSILLISEESRGEGKPKESGDIEYTGHYIIKLESIPDGEKKNQKNKDKKLKLNIEYGRDVESNISIDYKADFDHWKIKEIDPLAEF